MSLAKTAGLAEARARRASRVKRRRLGAVSGWGSASASGLAVGLTSVSVFASVLLVVVVLYICVRSG
jgi:tetrahydromethanopterin S-methyltransferase subunit F